MLIYKENTKEHLHEQKRMPSIINGLLSSLGKSVSYVQVTFWTKKVQNAFPKVSFNKTYTANFYTDSNAKAVMIIPDIEVSLEIDKDVFKV